MFYFLRIKGDFMKYKAAIFDLDGTLINSTWVWVEIYKEFCANFKLEENSELYETMHMPPTECCAKIKSIYNLKQSVEELKNIFYETALKLYSEKVKLKPGVKQFLELLKSNKILMCIATSNFVKISEFILKKLEIVDYFKDFSYSDELGVNKKSAIIYLKSAEKIGMSPENCAVFEDIADPIHDVKAVNMGYFGIKDGCQSEEVVAKLKKYGDYYIEDYLDFIKNDYDKFF